MTIQGQQLSVHVLAAVTANQRVQVTGSSILLSNTGNETVTIDNFLTIAANQSLTLKTGDDMNVITWDMKVGFAGGGGNPRLEIVELRIDAEGYGNYNFK